MIISHKHKFIFLKTHKTGGTSLQIALSRHCGEDDIISKLHEEDEKELVNAGGLKQQNSEIPFAKYNGNDWFQYLLRGRKQYFTEHLEAAIVKRRVGNKIWDSYYKFCFERNPYDKVLSYYYWRTRNTKCTLDYFLDEELEGLSDFNIYGNSKGIVADEVFLYENLDASIEFLERKFQFEINMANVSAKSTHRPKMKSYESELTVNQKKIIAKAFEKEINLFYPALIKR